MADSNPKQSKPDLPKRKAFEFTMKKCAALGIRPNLTTQAYPLNVKIFMGFLILGCASACTVVYTIHDAAYTFVEYVQSTFAFTIAILFILTLLNIILQIEKMFEYINGCDALINCSKPEQSMFAVSIFFDSFLRNFQISS